MPSPPAVLGIPIDFVLFGLTLLGVAVFHHHTLRIALMGLATIAIYKIVFWFGSSAGVAISNMFPKARSVRAWVKAGWPIAVAYIVGFAVLIMSLGWHPLPKG